MTNKSEDKVADFLKHMLDTANSALTHADQIGLSKRLDKKFLSEFVVGFITECIEKQRVSDSSAKLEAK